MMYPSYKRIWAAVRQMRQALLCTKSQVVPMAEVEIMSDVLKSAPVCNLGTKAHWKSLKRTNIEVFDKFMKMIDPGFSIVDASVSKFSAWEDEYGNSCAGMRHKKSGASHGVIRAVKPNNWIVEGTYKDG